MKCVKLDKVCVCVSDRNAADAGLIKLFSGTSSSDRALQVTNVQPQRLIGGRGRPPARSLTGVGVAPDVAEDAVPRQQHAHSAHAAFPHVDVFPVIPLPA